MIDTVRMTLLMMRGEESCLDRLRDVKETVDRATGEVSSKGFLQNLHVTVNPNRIWITGSLATYLQGHNAFGPSCDDVEKAILDISERLCLPVDKATVFRLDLAQTVKVKHPVAEYLPLFITPPRMQRIDYPGESLILSNQQKTLQFYDKLAESQKKRKSGSDRRHANYLRSILGEGHWLRFELQLKKRVSDYFGTQEILASDLYDPHFYYLCVKAWEAEYFRIRKEHIVYLPGPFLGIRQLRRSLQASGLQRHGVENILQPIRQARKHGTLARHKAARLIRELGLLIKENPSAGVSCRPLAKELDRLIRQETRRLIAGLHTSED